MENEQTLHLLDPDLYGRLLDTMMYLDNRVVDTSKYPYYLLRLHTIADAETTYTISWHFPEWDYYIRQTLRALVLIEYVTYIPYGLNGYERVKELLKEYTYNGKTYDSVPELRFDILKKVLARYRVKVSDEDYLAILDYFNRYEKTIHDYGADVYEFTCFYCKYINQMVTAKGCSEVLYDNIDLVRPRYIKVYGEGTVIDLVKTFKYAKITTPPLSLDEEDFIIESLNLTRMKKRDASLPIRSF